MVDTITDKIAGLKFRESYLIPSRQGCQVNLYA